MFRALTIAGSDSSGGAGIQADLKTFQELRVFGMSALTVVTAQNTVGVQGIYPLTAEAVATQIDSVVTDIGVDAFKTGMLLNADLIHAVADRIQRHELKGFVLDPVMMSKSGASLLDPAAIESMKTSLFPLSTVVTPNIPEAIALAGTEDLREAACRLYDMGAQHIVIKGGYGHGPEVMDLFYDGTHFQEFTYPRIQTRNTHGTGCTFSAAIVASLAQGATVGEAVSFAKRYIHRAIEESLSLGKGHGPTNHWAFNDRSPKP